MRPFEGQPPAQGHSAERGVSAAQQTTGQKTEAGPATGARSQCASLPPPPPAPTCPHCLRLHHAAQPGAGRAGPSGQVLWTDGREWVLPQMTDSNLGLGISVRAGGVRRAESWVLTVGLTSGHIRGTVPQGRPAEQESWFEDIGKLVPDSPGGGNRRCPPRLHHAFALPLALVSLLC